MNPPIKSKKILITGGRGNIAQIVVRHLSLAYNIFAPSRQEMNLLEPETIHSYFQQNGPFDILLHTSIKGGRRTKEEDGQITHDNLYMFENIIRFASQFELIINLDSAASYDRASDICARSEDDIRSVPADYYGFSKYVIYQRTQNYENVVNFRIFNIVHEKEEPDRFISMCKNKKESNEPITIFEDKYFDFFHENDFVRVFQYYADHFDPHNPTHFPKTLNIVYPEKLLLSEIAKTIVGPENKNLINILTKVSRDTKHYSGDGSLLHSLPIPGLSTTSFLSYLNT
jgi:nucleoside-diphosphate-sugar epimerase